jgi:hypothetical protein
MSLVECKSIGKIKIIICCGIYMMAVYDELEKISYAAFVEPGRDFCGWYDNRTIVG